MPPRFLAARSALPPEGAPAALGAARRRLDMPPRSTASPVALPAEGAQTALGRPGGGLGMPPRSTASPAALPPEGAQTALGRSGGGLDVPPRFAAAPAALPSEGAQTASAMAREEISRNISELDQLVDEILLASRLDAREADLGTVEPVDLIGLLAEECARVGANLDLAPGTTEVVVPGVAKLLRRAVRNLLENAVRHGGRSGRGGEVSAEIGIVGGQAVLHVDDRGPGVPPGQRERIFEPFYRLPGASEREGGVGLGLALVKSIAERHHGSVDCDNRVGGGARFTLRLPTA